MPCKEPNTSFPQGQEGLLSQREKLQAPPGSSGGREKGKTLDIMSKKIMMGRSNGLRVLMGKKTFGFA